MMQKALYPLLLLLFWANAAQSQDNIPEPTEDDYYKIDMYIDSAINENTLTLIELSEAEFLKNKAEYGDIFFTRSSLVKEGIAYSNVYLGNSEDVTFDGHLIRMKPKKDLIDSVFLNYALKTSKIRIQFVIRGKTATMTTVESKSVKSAPAKTPDKSAENPSGPVT